MDKIFSLQIYPTYIEFGKRIYRKEIDLMNLPKALALHSRVQRRTPGCCVEQQKRLIH